MPPVRSFVPTTAESALGGVRIDGDTIVFGRGGDQAVTIVGSLVAMVAVVVVMWTAFPAWLAAGATIATVAVAPRLVLRMRRLVTLTPQGIDVLAERGPSLHYAWSEVHDVYIDARDTGVGESRLAANRGLPAWQLAAVIMTTDGRGHDVPAALGSTGPDGERGREAEAVTAKVALIRRYREVFAGPWPTPPGSA